MNLSLIHPGQATLVAFDANQLTPRRHDAVAGHLRSCVRCQESLRFVRRLSATASTLDLPAAPESLLERILADRSAGERVLLPSPGLQAEPARSRAIVVTKIAVAAVIALMLTLSVSPEGLSAASGRLVHNIVRNIPVLKSLVETKPAAVPPDTSIAARSAAIPVFALDAIEAKTDEPLTTVSAIKVFSDGRVLVNDVGAHSLRLFDPTLASSTLIAGPDGGTFKYGKQASLLIPYWGDSALFLDNASNAFLVLDANASVIRTIAFPPGTDWLGLISGQPVLDPQGRLLYRVPIVPADPLVNPRLRLYAKDVDSCAIVRANFDTRTIDTLGVVASGGVTRAPMMLSSGRQILHTTINPAPVHDDWAILPDGTVAIVRGRDYHIDWIHPDGTRTSSAKLPFDWRKLDEQAKQRLLDSAQAATEASMLRAIPNASSAQMHDQFELIGIDKLPNYYPPVRIGSRRVDSSGNLWIPPTTSLYPTVGGLIYDVVNRKGIISWRALLAPGYSVAGFGTNDAVYMIAADSTGVRIARAHLGHKPLSTR